MTKLDFKSGKCQEEKCQETVKTTPSENSGTEQQPKNHFESVLNTLKLNVENDAAGPHSGFSCIGVDWTFMSQVANAQATLSILSIICMLSSMFLTGSDLRVTSFTWAVYLMSCAYIGLRAGRWQSYTHAIVYCGMCTFQSFVYMSTMCWFIYSFYALNLNTQSYEFIHTTTSDLALVCALGEILCIMGTVLTGIFGLIGCCRGFGRLFHTLEKMILDYQNVIGAYNSARRLQTV